MKDELSRKDAMLGSLRQQVIDLTASGGAGHRAQYELFEQQHRLREDELHRTICTHTCMPSRINIIHHHLLLS